MEIKLMFSRVEGEHANQTAIWPERSTGLGGGFTWENLSPGFPLAHKGMPLQSSTGSLIVTSLAVILIPNCKACLMQAITMGHVRKDNQVGDTTMENLTQGFTNVQ